MAFFSNEEETTGPASNGFCDCDNKECWFEHPYRVKAVKTWLKENPEYRWDSHRYSYVRNEKDGSYMPIDEGRLQREVKLGVK